MQEKDYPVKYAILELKAQGGRDLAYREVSYGFIASKCYLLEKTTSYKNCNPKEYYKVFFPYNDFETYMSKFKSPIYGVGKRNHLIFDDNNNPIKCTKVSKIFDTFEEAQELAKKLREDYKYLLLLPASQKVKMREEICDGLYLTEAYEELIEESTKDMEVTNSLGEQEHTSSSMFI